MVGSVRIQWLGVAGFQIRTETTTLLIDPYFTRLPFRKMWVGKVQPDLQVVHPDSYPADAILVSHSHVDHLLDVPAFARAYGEPVYGSANTAQLLALLDVPAEQIQQTSAGSSFCVGDIAIWVHPATHIRTPGFLPGTLPPDLHPPLRSRQYVMDEVFAFQMDTHGMHLLTDPGQPLPNISPVDVLFLYPFHPPALLAQILESTRPARILPSHWDDFWRPLSRPLKPMIQPPHHEWPPIGRADLEKFTRRVKSLSPGTEVIRLDWFEEVEINRQGPPVSRI